MTTNDIYMKHFFSVFEKMKRQGPGSRESTLRGFRSLPGNADIQAILEMGCGKGETSLTLAGVSDATITAVDNHPPFIAHLKEKAKRYSLGHRIQTVCGDMEHPSFPDESFDLIWAEGSAYIIGFEAALKTWRPLIRNHGFLFISDAVWMTDQPSNSARDFWNNEYPDLTDAMTRSKQAQSLGYDVVDLFHLPRADWTTFYTDMKGCMETAISEFGMTQAFKDMEAEIRLDETCGHEYGYACFLLQKKEPQ